MSLGSGRRLCCSSPHLNLAERAGGSADCDGYGGYALFDWDCFRGVPRHWYSCVEATKAALSPPRRKSVDRGVWWVICADGDVRTHHVTTGYLVADMDTWWGVCQLCGSVTFPGARLL